MELVAVIHTFQYTYLCYFQPHSNPLRVRKSNYLTLTLRVLMSYIYIYMEHPFLMFLDHTQRRTTVGRTPLDE